MYLNQLRREQLMDVRDAVRSWQAAVDRAVSVLTQLRAVFAIERSDTLAMFHVHQVPGADKLR